MGDAGSHRWLDAEGRREGSMKFELLPTATAALVAVITFLHLGTEIKADMLTDPTVQGAASFEQTATFIG